MFGQPRKRFHQQLYEGVWLPVRHEGLFLFVEIEPEQRRFIDDYHLEVGECRSYHLYHICEFAERMEEAGNVVIPIRSSLPQHCLSVSETTGKLIMLTRGEPGYREVGVCKEGMTVRETADEANRKLGVTKRQEAAIW